MAASAFHLGGAIGKQLQKQSGEFATPKGGQGSCTVTANYSGICIFSAHGSTSYFTCTLKQNNTSIAIGTTKESGNGLPDGGKNNGFDLYYSNQYANGSCCKAFKVKKGDVIWFGFGSDGGKCLWNMSIWG